MGKSYDNDDVSKKNKLSGLLKHFEYSFLTYEYCAIFKTLDNIKIFILF